MRHKINGIRSLEEMVELLIDNKAAGITEVYELQTPHEIGSQIVVTVNRIPTFLSQLAVLVSKQMDWLVEERDLIDDVTPAEPEPTPIRPRPSNTGPTFH